MNKNLNRAGEMAQPLRITIVLTEDQVPRYSPLTSVDYGPACGTHIFMQAKYLHILNKKF